MKSNDRIMNIFFKSTVITAAIMMMAVTPRERFSIPLHENDWCEWDLEAQYIIDPAEFESKGKATPFAGETVCGRCLKTVHAGRTVFTV